MGLRIARRMAQSACSSNMQGAARFALAAVLAVTLAYPVAGATNRAFADEAQEAASENVREAALEGAREAAPDEAQEAVSDSAQEAAPASTQKVVQGGLHFATASLADGSFLVGTTRDLYVDGAFNPISDGSDTDWHEAWEGEDYSARSTAENYTVSSSDPSVATIEAIAPQGDRTSGWLRVEAKSAGKATLAIQYRYVGKYAVYEGSQSLEVVVSSDSNPIVSISCKDPIQAAMITKCAICGETHANEGYTTVPLQLKMQDPEKPYTSDQVIEVVSSDEAVMQVGYSTYPEEDGSFSLYVKANSIGDAKITVTAFTATGEGRTQTATATFDAKSVDAGAPNMNIGEREVSRAFALDDLWIYRSFMIEGGLVSYDRSNALGQWPYCPNLNGFDGFKGTVNGEEVTVLSVESDNEAVAEIGGNGAEDGHRLIFSKAGTAHVTFKDIWGNENTIAATGVSREEEAKKLSLSQNELTIKQGETVDARSVVKGWDSLDPTVNTGESLVFRSGDKSVATVEWRQEANGHGQISWITGNKVGDVTMTVGLRKSAATGTQLASDTWELLEFGTLTVHVVADEAPEPDPVPATGITLDREAAIIIGAKSTKFTATVAPENASNKNVTWASSNSAVATVDADGVVKAVAKGETVITATAADGKHAATCAVTVYNPITSVELQPTMDLVKGATGTLEATLKGDLPGEMDEPETLRFSSGCEDVASLMQSGSKATLTALKSGASPVRLVVRTSTPVDENTQQIKMMLRDCLVTVTNPATSITLSDTTKTATVGDDPIQLTAKVSPSDADGTIAWSSSDAKVATVDANGKVTVKAAGSAVITAKIGAVSASCAVKVNSRQIESVPQESGFAATVIVSDSETAKVLDQYANEGVNLVVESIAELTQPAKVAIEKLTEAGAKVADAFDIRFTKDNGDTIVLSTDKNGKVSLTVKVALSDSMRALLDQGLVLKVHYVGPDGTIEEKQTWVEGDNLYFVTEHFSDYVVMGVPPTQAADDVVATPTTLPKACTGGSALAATGDSSVPVVTGSFAVLLAACGALTLAIRKRKSAR